MPFLLDTNCWMQLVRRREHSSAVADLLRVVPPENLYTTDFAVHSLRIAMQRHAQHNAYQYVAAELNNLNLVSLDADFDRTPNGRLTPAAALQQFTDERQK